MLLRDDANKDVGVASVTNDAQRRRGGAGAVVLAAVLM